MQCWLLADIPLSQVSSEFLVDIRIWSIMLIIYQLKSYTGSSDEVGSDWVIVIYSPARIITIQKTGISIVYFSLSLPRLKGNLEQQNQTEFHIQFLFHIYQLKSYSDCWSLMLSNFNVRTETQDYKGQAGLSNSK